MTFFCPIRKYDIQRTPEEEVRQSILFLMIHHLGYPEGLIAVEKSLTTLPNLKESQRAPLRRIDIVAFTSDLSPLLLIECKASLWKPAIFLQLLGYNRFIGAPWIAIANSEQIQAGCSIKGEWIFRDNIPHYEEARKIAPS